VSARAPSLMSMTLLMPTTSCGVLV